MPVPGKLKQFLKAQGVRYEIRSHPPAFTAQEVAAAEHVPGREVAKVVIVHAADGFLMAVLAAPHHVDFDRLAHATGRTGLRLATEAECTALFPDCAPGAMPPFGNLYGLPVWVETALTRDEQIVFNAGNHAQTVHMAYAEFARLARPSVAFFRTGAEAS